jgi:hypothetical protein
MLAEETVGASEICPRVGEHDCGLLADETQRELARRLLRRINCRNHLARLPGTRERSRRTSRG